MTFWKCYYHIVWTTKQRLPLITPTVEPVLFGIIQQECEPLNCAIHALNAVTDHVHLACSIPPAVAVAKLMNTLKGKSSFEINRAFDNMDRFQWQDGYGVLTFGEKNLPFVQAYVENQKQHHTERKLFPALEKTT